MDILLDTHILFWSITQSRKLSARLVEQLESRQNRIWLSAICLAELNIKQRIGKLSIPDGFERAVNDLNLEPLPFRADHAAVLGTLELHHRDPFDRMIIAQALVGDMLIATQDAQFRKYPVKLLMN